MTDDGTFALISKMSGVEHYRLANDVGGPDKVVAAGFISLYRGELTTWGKSYSMDLNSRMSDGRIIQEAIETGKVRIDQGEYQWGFAAGNHECMMAPDNEVATIELLLERGIFPSED
jgi:hypothetical protein